MSSHDAPQMSSEWADSFAEHQAFLMRLARSLTSDFHAAQDAVQETVVAAARQGRAPSGSVRAFLAGILRNRVRKAQRGEARRAYHERAAARAEASAHGDEALVGAQLEAQRRMLAALERLDEPYRTTLVLRYQHELTPARIAERDGTSVHTVKSRLKRGLDRLRRELDREYGARREWAFALVGLPRVPLSAPPAGSLAAGSLALGVSIMSAKGMLAAAAAVVVLVAAWRWAGTGDAVGVLATDEEFAAEEVTLTGTREPRPARVAVEEGPDAAPAGEPAIESPEEAPSATAPFASGNVYDLAGRGVPNVKLVFRPNLKEPVELEADGRGGFRVPDPSRGTVFVRDERLWNLCPGTLGEPPDTGSPVVVVAPRVHVDLFVRNTREEPVAGAMVEVLLPTGWESALPVPLDHARAAQVLHVTDERGRVKQDVPLVPDATVRVTAGPKYFPRILAFEHLLTPGVTLTLHDVPEQDAVLSGLVVDTDGAPVADVLLCVGRREAHTNAEGLFRFEGEPLPPGAPLQALKRGYLPGRIDAPAVPGAVEAGWPDHVTLRLEPGTLSLRGVVVDGAGEPLEGVVVQVVELTYWGVVRGTHESAEDLLGGDTAYTDADGRFELVGLADREYDLSAIRFSTLWSARVDAVRPGGETLRIVLAASPDARTVTGTCVAPDGTPLAGVQVAPKLTVARAMAGAPFELSAESGILGAASVTDEDGRFVLADLPSEVTLLQVESSATMPLTVELARGDTEPELVIDRRAAFELELSGAPMNAGSFRMLDADGELLTVHAFSGHGSAACGQCPLVAGKSGIRTVSERAKELVLYRGGDVLQRAAVELVPGEVTRLRLH